MNSIYYGSIPLCSESDLAHHGVIGQKWGIRRYQNEDSSLTSAGKAKYGNIHERNGGIIQNDNKSPSNASSIGFNSENNGTNRIGLIKQQREKIAEIFKERAEKQRQRDIEKGKVYSQDKNFISNEHKKLALKLLGTFAAGTFLNAFAGDYKTRGLIDLGASVVASIITTNHLNRVRAIDVYQESKIRG